MNRSSKDLVDGVSKVGKFTFHSSISNSAKMGYHNALIITVLANIVIKYYLLKTKVENKFKKLKLIFRNDFLKTARKGTSFVTIFGKLLQNNKS